MTLDLDFANPLQFTPSRGAGIAVLRLPPRPAAGDLFDAVRTDEDPFRPVGSAA